MNYLILSYLILYIYKIRLDFKHMAIFTTNNNEEYKKAYIPTCIAYSKLIH